MKIETGRLVPRSDRVGTAVVTVVGLSVAMMFGLLYTLTPPTMTMVEHQYSVSEK
jgi:hypothetical protein